MALVGLCILAGALLLYHGRELTFFFDEWNFILQRRGFTLDTFLRPHGGDHLSIVPIAIYKALLQVFGLRSYLPYQLLLIGAHLLCGVLLWFYARRRLGDWLALAPAALLLFLGSAWQDLLWPFQMAWIISVLAGLAMLLSLDASPARPWLAGSMLALSLASSGIGLPILAVAAVDVALSPERRRRMWVVIAPAGLFAIWYLFYGGEGSASTNIAGPSGTLHYGLEMAAAGVAGLGGLSLEWGRSLFVGALAGFVAALSLRRPGGQVRLLAVGAGTMGFWLLTAATRADYLPAVPADTSRYLYVSGAFLLLLAVGALAGATVGRRAGAGLAVGVAVLCVMNVGALEAGGNGLREVSQIVRVELAAVEAARGEVEPSFVVDPQRAPAIPAGPYLDAIEEFGSPAYSVDEIRHNVIPDAGAVFDSALLRALDVAPQPAGPVAEGAAPPTVEATSSGQYAPEGACQAFTPAGSGATLEVAVPSSGVIVSADPEGAPVELRFRQLAAQYGAEPTFTLPGDSEPTLVQFPTESPDGQWFLQVTAGQPVRVCAAG